MSACPRDNVANQLKSYNTNNSNNNDVLTASNGCPVDSLTASLTDGPFGNIPLKDFTLIDHLAAFDRERIPERVVHAKGEEKIVKLKLFITVVLFLFSSDWLNVYTVNCI